MRRSRPPPAPADEPVAGDAFARFVIVAAPRTGSYHLASLLDSAPDIVCHGELFKGGRTELRPRYEALVEARTVAERDAHALDYLARIRAADPDRHFGFKLFLPHLKRAPELRQVMRSKQWKKIVLVRDPLEVYGSLLRAKTSGVWAHFDATPEGSGAPPRATFTPETLDRFAANYNRFLSRAARMRGRPDVAVMRYPDLADPARLQRLLGFLGSVAAAPALTSGFTRQYAGPTAEGFTNWDDLQAYCAAAPRFVDLPEATI